MNSSELPARCCSSSTPFTHCRARAWVPLGVSSLDLYSQCAAIRGWPSPPSRGYGSGSRWAPRACRTGWYAATGSRWPWESRCSPEASGERLVQAVHGAQYAIAGIDLVDDDAEGVDVHDLVERLTLAAHLLVDAVEVLLAADHLAFHAFAGEAVDQRLLDLDDLAAVAAGLLHRLADALGAHRVHGLETEVLELHAHGVHAQAVGDGRVDFQGFLGDAPALRRTAPRGCACCAGGRPA